jgi:hypothetical protein
MLVDIKVEVYAALKRACERVFPSIPDAEAELPCISYFESQNVPASSADDDEYSSLIEFTIDIWGNSFEQITPVAQRVEQEMRALGFVRTHCTDIPPDHKNMMYQIDLGG